MQIFGDADLDRKDATLVWPFSASITIKWHPIEGLASEKVASELVVRGFSFYREFFVTGVPV